MALAPLLIIAVAVVGFVYGDAAEAGKARAQLAECVNAHIAQARGQGSGEGEDFAVSWLCLLVVLSTSVRTLSAPDCAAPQGQLTTA